MAVGDIVKSGEGKKMVKDPKVSIHTTQTTQPHDTTQHHINPTYPNNPTAKPKQAFWKDENSRDNDPIHVPSVDRVDYDAPVERVSCLGGNEERENCIGGGLHRTGE